MPMNRLKLQGGSRGGVHDALIREIEKFGTLASLPGKVTWTDGDGLHVHPDYLKKAIFDLLDSVGCTYLLYSPVTGAVVSEGRVRQVEVQTKQGKERMTRRYSLTAQETGIFQFSAVRTMKSDGKRMGR